MKKIYIIFAALGLFTACSLDQFPPSETAAADFIKDDASLNAVVNGMYNGMYSVLYNEWAVTELRTNNVRMRASGSTANDTKLVEQLDQGTIDASNTFHSDYWEAAYKTINRANNVVWNLDKAKDENKRAMYKGEALFIRSLLYFNLARLWGPVFLIRSKEDVENARNLQRTPLEEVYAFIEHDLSEIIENGLLPEKMPEELRGRAELDAAKVLLAKLYMTTAKVGTAKYTRAKNLLKDVVEARYTGTLVDYDRVFATDNEMNAEIIFAIRYKSGNLGLGAPFSSLYGPLNNANNVVVGSPKHYNYPSDNFIAAIEEGDKRKDVLLQEKYFNKTTGEWIENPTLARFCNKFIDYNQTTAYDAETDFPIIRLADAMLLYAETICETEGPNSEALALLNAIRLRAGLPAKTSAELDSRYTFRMALRQERRIELGMENHHWYDLLRWGVAVATVNDFLENEALFGTYSYKVNPIQEWQCLLPIPTAVRNINPTVAQNPGY